MTDWLIAGITVDDLLVNYLMIENGPFLRFHIAARLSTRIAPEMSALSGVLVSGIVFER